MDKKNKHIEILDTLKDITLPEKKSIYVEQAESKPKIFDYSLSATLHINNYNCNLQKEIKYLLSEGWQILEEKDCFLKIKKGSVVRNIDRRFSSKTIHLTDQYVGTLSNFYFKLGFNKDRVDNIRFDIKVANQKLWKTYYTKNGFVFLDFDIQPNTTYEIRFSTRYDHIWSSFSNIYKIRLNRNV